MPILEVFRVIYAPHKAFKEIVQKPGYKGPIVALLLFILSFSGFYYILSSRVYYDQTAPTLSEKDEWTEKVAYWDSAALTLIVENATDYIKGDCYGNKSIQFSKENIAKIYMRLNITSQLKFLDSDGYTKISFRIKIVKPSTRPSNMSVYLFSSNADEFFYYLLEDGVADVGVWDNKTIPLSSFTQFNDADWNNIKSLKIELAWSDAENITVLIDGLFFHGVYKSGVELYGNLMLANFVILAFMQFSVQWICLSIFLYLFSMLFRLKPVWRNMLTIAGFSLITLFVQYVFLTGMVFAYPKIYFSLESLGGVPGEGLTTDVQIFQSMLFVQYYIVERLVYYVWIAALFSIAVHAMFALPWMRSVSIAISSVIPSVVMFRLLSYGMIWL